MVSMQHDRLSCCRDSPDWNKLNQAHLLLLYTTKLSRMKSSTLLRRWLTGILGQNEIPCLWDEFLIHEKSRTVGHGSCAHQSYLLKTKSTNDHSLCEVKDKISVEFPKTILGKLIILYVVTKQGLICKGMWGIHPCHYILRKLKFSKILIFTTVWSWDNHTSSLHECCITDALGSAQQTEHPPRIGSQSKITNQQEGQLAEAKIGEYVPKN